MPHFSVIGSLPKRKNITSSGLKKFLLSNKQDVVCKKIFDFFSKRGVRQDLSNNAESLHRLRTSTLNVWLNCIFGAYVAYSTCTVKSIFFN